MKEICTLLVKLYIICSRMQRVNLHARPSIIQVGLLSGVCTGPWKGGTADLDYHSEPCRRNDCKSDFFPPGHGIIFYIPLHLKIFILT